MTVLTLSQAAADTTGKCVISQKTYEFEDTSDSTGASVSRLLGPPRWSMALSAMDILTSAQSPEWEMLMFRMRGTINRLAVWDVSRAVPRGTLALSGLTLVGAQALGDTTVVVGGAGAAQTVKMGDWLQIGTGIGTSQLVKVSADATATGGGQVTLSIEPPLRLAFSGGSAVVSNKPVAYYKKMGGATSYSTDGYNYTGHSLDLLEQWN